MTATVTLLVDDAADLTPRAQRSSLSPYSDGSPICSVGFSMGFSVVGSPAEMRRLAEAAIAAAAMGDALAHPMVSSLPVSGRNLTAEHTGGWPA